MSRSQTKHRLYRATIAALGVAVVSLAVLAVPALADAPDPIVSQTHLVDSVHNPDGSITVTIAGGWQWTTHHSDCSTDRAGVGYAIAWNDPSAPGNFVGTNALNTLVGTPSDNTVHSVPPNNQDVSDPSQFMSWRGGCGTFNGTFNTGTWGPISHTYPAGTGPITVCPIMYDVHGKAAGSPPNSAKEVTAGGSNRNGDNSIETNGDTPLGNGCFATTFPSLTTTATTPATAGTPVHDVAHLRGTNPTGTITFKLYPAGDTNCTQTPIYTSSAVAVNGNGDYRSPMLEDPIPPAVGSYNWRAFYSGDAHNNPASTPCGDANETTTVNPATPTVTTTASSGGTVGTAVHDTAHLSGATSNAGGSLTFKLYGPDDASCATAVFTSTAVAVNGNGDYSSPSFTPTAAGTYRWIASYSGDASNSAAATGCNDVNESVLIGPPPSTPTPGISVVKLQRIDGSTGTYTTATLTATAGQRVDYEMVVSNTGALPLALSFSDPHCDAGSLTGPTGDLNSDGTLKPHGQATYFCFHIVQASDTPSFTNVVTVSGTPPGGPPVGPVSSSVTVNVPAQQVSPSCVVGAVALNGTVGCARRAFAAVVQAAPNSIKSVTFRLDGKVVRTLTHAGAGNRWALTIHPNQLRTGGHTLTAVVTLNCNGARRTVTLHFRHCPPPKPRFTG